jgi:hypothetical protein
MRRRIHRVRRESCPEKDSMPLPFTDAKAKTTARIKLPLE